MVLRGTMRPVAERARSQGPEAFPCIGMTSERKRARHCIKERNVRLVPAEDCEQRHRESWRQRFVTGTRVERIGSKNGRMPVERASTGVRGAPICFTMHRGRICHQRFGNSAMIMLCLTSRLFDIRAECAASSRAIPSMIAQSHGQSGLRAKSRDGGAWSLWDPAIWLPHTETASSTRESSL